MYRNTYRVDHELVWKRSRISGSKRPFATRSHVTYFNHDGWKEQKDQLLESQFEVIDQKTKIL